MFWWKQGEKLVEQVEDYLEKAEACLTLFHQAFARYVESGPSADFDHLVEKTHIAESTCDDLRRKIETTMYEKALIPESRGDVMKLLEAIDRIPNKAESVLYMVQSESLQIPEVLSGKMRQLAEVNRETFSLLIEATKSLFEHTGRVQSRTDEVDKNESASDVLEREIVRQMFSAPEIAPDQRILLKELVIEMGKISDRCENAADTLNIIAVKRLV